MSHSDNLSARDAYGTVKQIPPPAPFGRADALDSKPIALSNEDFAAITALRGSIDGLKSSFNRPPNTTQYGLYEFMGPTGGTPLHWTFTNNYGAQLYGVTVRKGGTSVTNCQLRTHFFGAEVTNGNADNLAYLPSDMSSWRGFAYTIVDKAGAAGAAGIGGVMGNKPYITIPAGMTELWGLIELAAQYAPASGSGGSGESIEVELDMVFL